MQDRSPLFHLRPWFIAALGLCFGTGLFALFSGVQIRAALLFLSGFLLLLLLCKRSQGTWFVFCLLLGLIRSFFAPLTLPASVTALFSDLSAAIGDRIDLLFPDHAGVARGMLLGARNASLNAALSERLYDVGVGHLLAVSGLHVAILAGSLRIIWRRYALRLRFAVLCIFLLFYILLTGGAPSVIRASIMLLCTTPMSLSLRKPDALTSLSIACCAVVLLDPTAPATVGFQLSFLAVLGLQLLSAPLQKRFSYLGHTVSTALAATIAATIGTLPIMCYAFSEISVFGLVANLLVVPLAAFFLVPAFLCTLLSFPFPMLADAIAALPRLVLDMMMTLATAGGSTVLRIAAPSIPAILLYYAALFLLSGYCLRSKRQRLLYSGICMLAAILLWTI